MKRLCVVVFATLFFAFPSLKAQCLLQEIPLADRIKSSTTIVEGKVIAKRSFWDDDQHNIFTANTIEIYKVFNGEVVSEEIEVLTRGGIVGLEAQVDHPSLQLSLHESGVFFLQENKVNTKANRTESSLFFQPTAGPQAFVKYDFLTGTANDPFAKYTDIEQELYRVIEKEVSQSYQEIAKFKLPKVDQGVEKTLVSFSPTSITAGKKEVLTINGSGFGATQGDVYFKNADDGGATFIAALATEIISWTDTEIQVEVPSDAGTGTVIVLDLNSNSHPSASALTIIYAETNVLFDPGIGTKSFQSQHINDDGVGGYTFRYFTDFAASSAVAPFQRALENWCNETNINISIGTNTSVDVAASDGTNVVRFDNNELPSGILGQTTSYYSGCFVGPNDVDWFVTEIDFDFNEDFNWNFELDPPGPSQYDFETVVLHEMGHAHQLGHVINNSLAMHYSLSNGTMHRTLDPTTEVVGAIDIYNRSTTTSVCGQPPMLTNVNCAALAVLPVELIRFDGRLAGKTNVIEWETASEINVFEHVLERSPNGIDGYEVIARQPGSAFSSELLNYQYIDRNPWPLGYYRLTTYDFDGKTERHKVISLKRNDNHLVIYEPNPNPFSDRITIPNFSIEPTFIQYNLVNQIGQTVQSGQLELPQGYNHYELPIDAAPAGVYYLNLFTDLDSYLFQVVRER